MMVFMAVLVSGSALGGCPDPTDLDAVLARVTSITGALDSGRNLTARDEARRLREDVRCLGEPLPDAGVAAVVARAIGAGYVAGKEPAIGTPWLRNAFDLEPDHAWELPPGHPVVAVWQDVAAEPAPPEERLSDDGFVAAAWLDGTPIDEPVARIDRPHIFQLGTAPTETYIIFGNRFPSDVLGEPASEPRRRRRDRPEPAPVTSDGPLVLDRVRPPEKTPLLVSGAALVVVAGGMYGLAAQRRQRFDDPSGASTLDELSTLRNQVNGLVIASAATFALGAGGVTWGTLVDARGGARLRTRF